MINSHLFNNKLLRSKEEKRKLEAQNYSAILIARVTTNALIRDAITIDQNKSQPYLPRGRLIVYYNRDTQSLFPNN